MWSRRHFRRPPDDIAAYLRRVSPSTRSRTDGSLRSRRTTRPKFEGELCGELCRSLSIRPSFDGPFFRLYLFYLFCFRNEKRRTLVIVSASNNNNKNNNDICPCCRCSSKSRTDLCFHFIGLLSRFLPSPTNTKEKTGVNRTLPKLTVQRLIFRKPFDFCIENNHRRREQPTTTTTLEDRRSCPLRQRRTLAWSCASGLLTWGVLFEGNKLERILNIGKSSNTQS